MLAWFYALNLPKIVCWSGPTPLGELTDSLSASCLLVRTHPTGGAYRLPVCIMGEGMGKGRWKGGRGRKGMGERGGGKGRKGEGGVPPPNENPGNGPAQQTLATWRGHVPRARYRYGKTVSAFIVKLSALVGSGSGFWAKLIQNRECWTKTRHDHVVAPSGEC